MDSVRQDGRLFKNANTVTKTNLSNCYCCFL